MRRFRFLSPLLAACVLVPAGLDAQARRCLQGSAGGGVQVGGCVSGSAPAPLNVPRIVQIPIDDFVWHWGDTPVEERTDPDFSVHGNEEKFICHLTGLLESSDPRRLSDLEYVLTSTSKFIQEATARMNNLFRLESGNRWATLSCAVADVSPAEVQQQVRIENALERAERQRERRRARSAGNE